MEGAGVELEPDDGEDKDGEGDEEPNLHEGGEGFEDGLEDNLEAWREGLGFIIYTFCANIYIFRLIVSIY